MEDALKNTVVLRHLFRFLSNPDLLRCSLVNKQWNFEARSFLRDSRKCFARVTDSELENSLNAFNEDLMRMSSSNRPNPYNGLYLEIGLEEEESLQVCRDPSNRKWSLEFIQDEWPLKYLKIRWKRFDDHLLYCQCARLIPNLLRKKGESLEELIFEKLPRNEMDSSTHHIDGVFQYMKRTDEEKLNESSDDEFYYDDEDDRPFRNYSKVIETIVLPKLRILKFRHGICANFLQSKFMRQLLRNGGAPALQELDFITFPFLGWPSFVPEDKLNLVTRYILRQDNAPAAMSTFLAAGPKLRELRVLFTRPHVNWNVILDFLRQSSGTLRTLKFSSDVFAMIPDKMSEMPVLPKVKDVTIDLNREFMRQNQNYRDHMSSVNFSRIFPKSSAGLNFTLTINYVDSWRDEVWMDREIPQVTEGGAASAVTRRLHIADMRIVDTLPYLAEMFPNVEEVSVRCRGLDPCLWTSWKKLRHMYLEIDIGQGFENWNFDASFCGIHSDEVALLTQYDDDYLTRVHIVPSSPPLSYLRDLKVLEIHIDPCNRLPPATFATLPERISKVSKFVGFRHMPGLKVTFKGGSPVYGRRNLSVVLGRNREAVKNTAAAAGVNCKIV